MALALASVLAPAGLTASPPPRTASPIEAVAVHPDARRQPTPMGRTLAALAPLDGALYAGYGDYDANTGPVRLRSLKPGLGRFSPPLAALDTEAIYRFRPAPGALAVPFIDPLRDAGAGYALGRGSDFKVIRTPPATHLFDVLVTDGSDVWLFGSRGTHAMVWRRAAGGDTFESVLEVAPADGAAFARTYSGFELAGTVCTHVMHAGGPLETRARCLSRGGWRPGPPLFPDDTRYTDHFLWRPTRFAGHLVYMDAHSGLPRVFSRLFAADGRTVRYAFGSADAYDPGRREDAVLDFAVSGQTLYLLTALGEVYVSDDLERWRLEARVVLPGSESAASIAVTDRIFVGTTASRVVAVTGPLGPIAAPRSTPARRLLTATATVGGLLVAGLGFSAMTHRYNPWRVAGADDAGALEPSGEQMS